MLGNLADLAATGLASEPTLRTWIKSQPDQPWIIKRGDRGVDYEIDIVLAVEAWKAEETRKTEEARQRANDLQQLGFDLGLTAPAPEAIGLSIKERTALLEEQLVAIKLGKERRELIHFAEVEATIGDAVAMFRQRGDTFAARLGKRIDLTRDQIAAIEKLIRADQAELAKMMEDWRPKGGDEAPAAAAELEDPAISNRG